MKCVTVNKHRFGFANDSNSKQ